MNVGRCVIIEISYGLLEELLQLPKGVRIVRHLPYDDLFYRGSTFKLILEGERFPEVPEGGLIPTAEVICRRTEIDMEFKLP